jgi:fatty acid desaturase
LLYLLESSYNIRINIIIKGDEGMDQSNFLKWETIRKMGKSKYITLYWVVAFGLGVALALTLIEWATEKRINAAWVFIRILVFPIVGSLMGNVKWSKQEAKYKQYQEISAGKPL